MQLSLPRQLLIGLCALHFLFNVLWLVQNTAPLPWDQAGHTYQSVRYSQYFRGMLPEEEVKNPLTISTYYPPLVHITTSVFITLLGSHIFVASLPITLFFVMLLVGIFYLTNLLYKNEWVALTATILFSLLPVIYENSRWFLLEIPMLAFLMLSLAFLYKSEGFSKWRYCFLFSLSAGALLLTKWTGAIFLVVPGIAVLFHAWKKQHTKSTVSNMILASLIILIIAFPWYSLNLETLFSTGSQAIKGEESDPQKLLSIQNIVFYLHQFINFQVSLWPSLILIVATGVYATIKKAPYKKLFIGSLLVYYVFFTLISNKDIRYTIPLLLIPILSTSYLLIQWYQQKRLLFSITAAGLAPLVFYYFVLSFGIVPPYQAAWNLGPLGWYDYFNTTNVVVSAPRKDETPNRIILSDIKQHSKGTHVNAYIGVDQVQINPATFDLYRILGNYSTISLPKLPFNQTQFETDQEIANYLSKFDYYVLPEGVAGTPASRNRIALEQIRDYILRQHLNEYLILREYRSSGPEGRMLLVTSL